MLDLKNDLYCPYKKENSTIKYVDSRSNHPRYVLDQIPRTINYRLNGLSKNERVFTASCGPYQAALDKGLYKHKLVYREVEKRKRQRRRKIIFYQPPFCKTVSTNISRCFINLVNKHFTDEHRYHKIFNKNKLRVSFCCMPNVKSLITAHNNRLLHEQDGSTVKKCNCRMKSACPVNMNCLERNLIYRATVRSEKGVKTYLGSTGNTFKERYRGHQATFKKTDDRNKTELARYVWELQDEKIKYELEWEIVKKTNKRYSRKFGCTLCNMERIAIMEADKGISLNKRKELCAKCPHYRKMFLNKLPDDHAVK